MAYSPFTLNETQAYVLDALIAGDYEIPGVEKLSDACQKLGIPTIDNALGKAIVKNIAKRDELKEQAMQQLESGTVEKAEEYIALMNSIVVDPEELATPRQQARLAEAYAELTGEEQPETSHPSVHVDLGGTAAPVVMGKVFTDQPRVWYQGPVKEFHGWARLYDGGTLVLEDGYVVLNNVDITHYIEEDKVTEDKVEAAKLPVDLTTTKPAAKKKAPAKKAAAAKAKPKAKKAKAADKTWGRYLNARRANGTHVNSRVKIPEHIDIEDLNACATYFKKHCKKKGWTFLSVGAKCAAK